MGVFVCVHPHHDFVGIGWFRLGHAGRGRLSPDGSGTNWPSSGRWGGQDRHGALLSCKAPYGATPRRTDGNKHHPGPW